MVTFFELIFYFVIKPMSGCFCKPRRIRVAPVSLPKITRFTKTKERLMHTARWFHLYMKNSSLHGLQHLTFDGLSLFERLFGWNIFILFQFKAFQNYLDSCVSVVHCCQCSLLEAVAGQIPRVVDCSVTGWTQTSSSRREFKFTKISNTRKFEPTAQEGGGGMEIAWRGVADPFFHKSFV